MRVVKQVAAQRSHLGDHVGGDLPLPLRLDATGAWSESGQRLVSIVLFGSVARGRARPTSDIDVLLVAEELPRSLADRRRPFLQAWERARAAQGLPHVEWNLITKTPEEASVRSPLYFGGVVEI